MSMRKNAEWILIEPFQMSLDKMLTPFGGLQQLCSITLYIIQHKSFMQILTKIQACRSPKNVHAQMFSIEGAL